MAKNFKDLSEQEILALAISSEETDARIYADFAAGLKTDYPATAQQRVQFWRVRQIAALRDLALHKD